MTPAQERFLSFILKKKILLFGDFTLKSGAKSPYFLNFGLLSDGEAFSELAAIYAEAILESALEFDVLYGPAYKGIPIATAVALCLFQKTGRSYGVAYRRKEAKDHGEGGHWVGAKVEGKRVLIIDDVIARGTALKESLSYLQEKTDAIAGFIVALDRLDLGEDGRTPFSGKLKGELKLPIFCGADFGHVLEYLEIHPELIAPDALELLQQSPLARVIREGTLQRV